MTTPLASIFGSGFLVIVPILVAAVGPYAPFAILGVCALAYAVGCVIRFNIAQVEPVLEIGPGWWTVAMEKTSDIAIIAAYVISICLYLHLMSAFVLTGIGKDTPFAEDVMTSCVIVLIVGIGLIKGLDRLEALEKWALYATLITIALLLGSFASHDIAVLTADAGMLLVDWPGHGFWEVLTVLAGTLIVVQGFETTRYLGSTYPADVRIQASRWSQILSSGVYITFVLVATPIVYLLDGSYGDNSLVALTRAIVPFMLAPLIAAAALSQFSAAVADTIAGLGNLKEVAASKISTRAGYLLIGSTALIITWSASTLELIAFASRSFALYYLLQCLVAITVARSKHHKALLAGLALILGFITVFAVPAG